MDQPADLRIAYGDPPEEDGPESDLEVEEIDFTEDVKQETGVRDRKLNEKSVQVEKQTEHKQVVWGAKFDHCVEGHYALIRVIYTEGRRIQSPNVDKKGFIGVALGCTELTTTRASLDATWYRMKQLKPQQVDAVSVAIYFQHLNKRKPSLPSHVRELLRDKDLFVGDT